MPGAGVQFAAQDRGRWRPRLLTTTGFARNIRMDIGGNLGKGIVDGFVEIAASKSTSILIRGFLEGIRGNNGQRDAARQAQREANAPIAGWTAKKSPAHNSPKNKAKLFAPTLPKLTGRRRQRQQQSRSAARQLRGAEEELAKATAKARLDIEENTLKRLLTSIKTASTNALSLPMPIMSASSKTNSSCKMWNASAYRPNFRPRKHGWPIHKGRIAGSIARRRNKSNWKRGFRFWKRAGRDGAQS